MELTLVRNEKGGKNIPRTFLIIYTFVAILAKNCTTEQLQRGLVIHNLTYNQPPLSRHHWGIENILKNFYNVLPYKIHFIPYPIYKGYYVIIGE